MVLRLLVVGFLALVLFHLTNVNAAKKKKECSPFPFVSLENGQIIRTDHQQYRFSCNGGYLLGGAPENVNCIRGKWSSRREPKCYPGENLCDDPPKVANAVIHGEDREIGSSVQYACKTGFQLVGKKEMRCTKTRHWDGRTPTCMDKNEPLEKVAERLKMSFVNKLTRNRTVIFGDPLKFLLLLALDYSPSLITASTYNVPGGKYLDQGSLRHGLDLVLVIDRSSSVGSVHLETAKNFVNFLLKRFKVRNEPNKRGGTQAAVLSFGTRVQMVFNMNNYSITDPLAASQAVGTIEPSGGGTNTEGALTTVIIDVSSHLRNKTKKALFLMTDGNPNINNPGITAEDMARNLRDGYNFEIFAAGIGKGINRTILAEIASKPPLSHVFMLTEYPDLNQLMKIVEDERPPAPPISKDQCGYEYPREINNPWLAILYISGREEQKNMRVCGGVLICSQWVLTAASCLLEGAERIDKEDVFVALGERNLLRKDKSQTNFYVLDIKLHNRFDPSDPLNNNLALVKLNEPAYKYRPVCLPRTDLNRPLHQDLNAYASIAGWGINAATPTHPSGAAIRYEITSSPVSLAQEDECPEKRHRSIFCAGQGNYTCLGLKGSPIVAVDPVTGLNHVLGVVAGRTHCLNGRNQYVELTRYIHWINLSTELCQEKHW